MKRSQSARRHFKALLLASLALLLQACASTSLRDDLEREPPSYASAPASHGPLAGIDLGSIDPAVVGGLHRERIQGHGPAAVAVVHGAVLARGRRRGRIEGMGQRNDAQVINAMVPLSEMFGYATDLRSATQGRATYSMEFEKYAEAPANVADAVLRKAS